MVARLRKFERQRNSRASQLRLDPFTIFLDENHSRTKPILEVLSETLAKEERVVRAAVDDGFPAGMLDEDWLPVVGRNQWIVVSADNKIKRPLQRELWFKHGVRGFLFTENRLRGETKAAILRSALPEMRALVRDNEPPFLGCLTIEGHAKIDLDLDAHKEVRRNEKRTQARASKPKKRRRDARKKTKRQIAVSGAR